MAAHKFCPHCGESLVTKVIEDMSKLACSVCDYIRWENPKPVVVLLIPAGRGLVLVRRKFAPMAGYRCLPGGFLNTLECPEVAAKREAKEETGLDVEIEKLVAVRTTPGNQLLMIYQSRPVYADPVAGSDAAEAGIFMPENLPDDIAFPIHQEMIERFFLESAVHPFYI